MGWTGQLFRLSDQIALWRVCLDVVTRYGEYAKAGGGGGLLVCLFGLAFAWEGNCLI